MTISRSSSFSVGRVLSLMDQAALWVETVLMTVCLHLTVLQGWWACFAQHHGSTHLQQYQASANSMVVSACVTGVLEQHLQTTAETGKAALVKTAQGLAQAPTQLLQVLQGQGVGA